MNKEENTAFAEIEQDRDNALRVEGAEAMRKLCLNMLNAAITGQKPFVATNPFAQSCSLALSMIAEVITVANAEALIKQEQTK